MVVLGEKNKERQCVLYKWFFVLLLIISNSCFSDVIEDQIDPEIYQNKYGYYYVPMNHDRPAVNLIKKGLVYEQKTLEYIEKIYEKETSIVHAGTFFGDMLPFFSKLVASETVWAFEPIYLNFSNCS